MPWPPHSGSVFSVNPVSGGGRHDQMDLVVNGAMAADTDWTKGAGWTIAVGIATATAAEGDLSQPIAVTPGRNYSITYTVTSFTAGTVTVKLGGTAGTARGSASTFTETVKAGADGLLVFDAATATLAIDNVSVREL